MKPQARKVKVTYECVLSRFRPGYIARGELFALRGYEEKAVRRRICTWFNCNLDDIYYLAMDFPGMWKDQEGV